MCPCSYGAPLHRQDWFVFRGGREVRYVVDVYAEPSAEATPEVSSLPSLLLCTPSQAAAQRRGSFFVQSHPGSSSGPPLARATLVDVRPAVDDLGSALDRLRLFPGRAAEAFRRPWFRAEVGPTDPARGGAAGVRHSQSTADAAQPVAQLEFTASDRDWAAYNRECGALEERVHNASLPGSGVSAADLRLLTRKLRLCAGRCVCPDASAKFRSIVEAAKCVGGHDGEAASPEGRAALAALDECVTQRAFEREEEIERRRLRAVAAASQRAATGLPQGSDGGESESAPAGHAVSQLK